MGLADPDIVAACPGAFHVGRAFPARRGQVVPGQRDASQIVVPRQRVVLLDRGRQTGPRHQVVRLPVALPGRGHTAGLEEDVAHGHQVGRHGRRVSRRRSQGVRLARDLERAVRLSLSDVGMEQGRKRDAALPVIASPLQVAFRFRDRGGMAARIHVVRRDAHVRRPETGIDRERLPVLRDRLVEPAQLHQQLGVGVVGVRIVRHQLDVLPECLLRLRHAVRGPIGVTHRVVRERERRIDREGLSILGDGLVMPAGGVVGAAQEPVGPFVAGILRDQCLEQPDHPGRIGFNSCLLGLDQQLLSRRSAARELCRALEVRRRGPGGRRGQREVVLGERERRVARHGLLEPGTAFAGLEPLDELPSLQVQRPGFLRARGNRDLPVLGEAVAGGHERQAGEQKATHGSSRDRGGPCYVARVRRAGRMRTSNVRAGATGTGGSVPVACAQ